jgi:hypothetical protein
MLGCRADFVVRRDIAKRVQGNLDAGSIHTGKLPDTAGGLVTRVAVKKQFQATASDLGEAKFPLCSECLRPLVKLVWELDLGVCYAVNLTSPGDAVSISHHVMTAESCDMEFQQYLAAAVRGSLVPFNKPLWTLPLPICFSRAWHRIRNLFNNSPHSAGALNPCCHWRARRCCCSSRCFSQWRTLRPTGSRGTSRREKSSARCSTSSARMFGVVLTQRLYLWMTTIVGEIERSKSETRVGETPTHLDEIRTTI